MSRVLTIREVCEQALRKIGTYSINDTGARAGEMDVAAFWLDMTIGHLAAKKRRWWLVPVTSSFTLVAGQTAYPLRATLDGAPEIQAVVGVWTVALDGARREPLEMMRRQEWEARTVTTGGPPTGCYVDRSNDPTLLINPVPAAPTLYQIEVVGQAFASDLSAASSDTGLVDLRRTWNLWAVTALAAELADGPIRKAPADEVRDARQRAQQLENDLDAWDAHEQADEPRRVSYNDF